MWCSNVGECFLLCQGDVDAIGIMQVRTRVSERVKDQSWEKRLSPTSFEVVRLRRQLFLALASMNSINKQETRL